MSESVLSLQSDLNARDKALRKSVKVIHTLEENLKREKNAIHDLTMAKNAIEAERRDLLREVKQLKEDVKSRALENKTKERGILQLTKDLNLVAHRNTAIDTTSSSVLPDPSRRLAPTEVDLFVPGRVFMFGEHANWTGVFRSLNDKILPGRSLVATTSCGLYATCKVHPSKLKMASTMPDGSVVSFECEMSSEALKKVALEGGFWSYGCGVAYVMFQHYEVNGLIINNYKTDLPMKEGLGSSSAFAILVARAFNTLYELKMTVYGESDAAYCGESLTRNRCDRVDYAGSFESGIVDFSFDGNCMDAMALSCPVSLHVLLVQIKQNDQAYGNKINKVLQSCYPKCKNPKHERVQEYFGEMNTKIIQEAVDIFALRHGDAGASKSPAKLKIQTDNVPSKLGALMSTTQIVFDKVVGQLFAELESPILHQLLACPELQPYICGGKGLYPQGDSSCLFLCPSLEAQLMAAKIVEDQFKLKVIACRLGC